MVSKSTTVPDRASPPSFGSAKPGPGSEKLSRAGYKTVSLQAELYERIQDQLPKHAKSVQAYVTFWCRVGVIIDDALDQELPGSELVTKVMEALANRS